MKKKVLVFPCGSEIGLEVYKAVRYSTYFELVGGSSVDDHGRFVYKQYVNDIPFVDDPEFVEKINAIVNEYHIDYLFPAHDSVVLKLARERDKLSCDVITSPVETCEVARSKVKTMELFKDELPTPRVFADAKEVKDEDFPVFLKPDVGQGSKGTQLAKNHDDIVFYAAKDPSLMILEFLPGKEYTVDCFTNHLGELVFCEGRERIRISNGISVSSARVNDDRFRAIAGKISEKLVFRGVWFFQVKEREDGEFALMEIAPRIAGTMGLVRGKGVNMALLSLFDAAGYDVDVFENKYNMTIDRALQNRYKHDIAYTHAYIDLDDLLVQDGRVNLQVMAFVFQCINKDIKVHLLTRHKQDLNETLRTYRLEGIFDEVSWIREEGDEKYLYIKEKDAIFIDDSHAERKKVHDKLGLPVFDGHMIESLLEDF